MQKLQEDDISWIIEIIRNLGVTIPNSIPVPSAVGCCRVAVSTPVAHPAVILNPCLKANFLQQKRLKCLVHYLKHYIRVQRDFVVTEATRQKLSDMAFQVELEQENEKLKVTFPKKLGSSKKNSQIHR